MKKEELIKKLEEVKAPNIEVPSHKARLKATLVDWNFKQKVGIGEIFVGLKR